MFLPRRPTLETINRFVAGSRGLSLSYGPVGLAGSKTDGYHFDEMTVVIGRGTADFERARAALIAWKQFEVGWVEVFPPRAPVAVGTVVAVLIRHLGLWSLNGCRVVYIVSSDADDCRFGFAYGALTNHAEAGEELFEVFLDRQTDDVFYRIRATSKPQALLARIGQPFVRMLQARFRRHSAEAMERATRSNELAESPTR